MYSSGEHNVIAVLFIHRWIESHMHSRVSMNNFIGI
jgi:hypothetical protein